MRTRFSQVLLAMVLACAMLTTGCAFLTRVKNDVRDRYCSTGLQCATTILTDFKWGVDEAGSRGNLPADEVAKVDVIVDGALAAVAKDQANWRNYVAIALSSIQANVNEPTQWVPYISAALLVLPLIPSSV